MAYTIPGKASLNIIDADPVSQLAIDAAFDSSIDALADVIVLSGVFEPGCPLLDINTGLTYVNRGTSAVPAFVESAVASLEVIGGTIATTGNTDFYAIVPKSGKISGAFFSALAALAANDTNYITFSITNLGQAGSGTNAILAATNANTTKLTGGSAIAANTKRTLTLNTTPSNLAVVAGDRLRIRAAATGTLAGAVTAPVFLLNIGQTTS